ncbi:MAG: Ribosomal RNA small subunit methyltransferase B [Alphaproteobacteria bacterium MarineAlpha9_Bin7]|nr:MAG: Ribosomal RNA small subunit methyltransferase B [Alphaproteobacteria bacterium MarineAlpha9_Bin7]
MLPSPISTRLVTLQLIDAILRRHRSLDEAAASHKVFLKLSYRDKAFVWLLVSTCLRRLGQVDDLIKHCLSSPLPDTAWRVNDLLRLGITQILFVGTPPYAAVDSAVSLVTTDLRRYRKLVNAVLRRVTREGAAWCAAQDAERLNTPDWLWKSWCASYGDLVARQISAAHLREAPLDITAKGVPEHLVKQLGANLLPSGTLRVEPGGPVGDRPGFVEGQWWVQDAAAALPVALFGDLNKSRVIDLCAAPGGKTAQLCSRGARVVAVDRSISRLRLLEDNLSRLGLSAELVNADAGEWRPTSLAKYVLLDAPCTATGTIRRHPDILHIKNRNDVEHAIAIQDRLLDSAIAMMEPGGLLVFATCSLQPEEGLERVANLLMRRPELQRVPLLSDECDYLAPFITDEGDLRTFPSHLEHQGGMDGFYAARLKRV